MSPDSNVYNARREIKERVGSLFMLEGKAQKPLELVGPGDIFAVAKLKETKTGDTLLAESVPFTLPNPVFPDPIMNMAVTPKTKADVEKIMPAFHKIMDEDPVLKVFRDEQTGEFILSGLGQLHIEIAVDRLKRRYGVEVELQDTQGPLQGDHHGQCRGTGQAQEADRRPRPVRRLLAQRGAPGTRRRLRVRRRHRGRRHPQAVHPGGGEGRDRVHADRAADGLPGGGHQGHGILRLVPRRGLLGNGLQDRRLAGLQEGHGAVPAHPARAHHEHRR
ncbi:MAG: hypothetical protein MZU91_03140 [Desulfosudis oleivorans]|nr:hypothetical protein [Desulfosudis oleivorans]